MLMYLYRWLSEFAILAVFVVSLLSVFGLVDGLLGQLLSSGIARIITCLLALTVGVLAWERYNDQVRRPLLTLLLRW